MSCCGSKRQNWNTPASHVLPEAHPSPPITQVKFRYTGKHSLVVTGGITGQVYRFLKPDDEVLIDQRDAPGMYAVPNVEVVRDTE